MSFFQKGLSHAELKKAYRELVKRHHPDVGGDTATMQAINEEYDKYFEVSASWTPAAAKAEREFIVLLVRIHGQLVAARSPRGWFDLPRIDFASPFWKDATEGFARVHQTPLGVEGQHIKVSCPNSRDTAIYLAGRVTSDHPSALYRCRVGDNEFYINCYNDIIAVDENHRFFSYNLYSTNGMTKIPIGTDLDFVFHEFQDCTYEEFMQWHDVDNKSDFHETLGMKEFEPFVDNGSISYMIRKGGLKVFHSRFDHNLKYGYFNMAKLLPLLKNLDIEDIEEAQDYLDEINEAFDAAVKSKIKKGKLRIVV